MALLPQSSFEELLMKTPVFARLLSRGLVGSLGIGMLLAGVAPSAKALTVNAGTDYLVTPKGGAKYSFVDPFPGAGIIDLEFSGLPIGTPSPLGPTPPNPDGGYSGLADTVVNRYDPVTASGGTTDIEIVGLSLKSTAPVTILGTDYDVFAGLQKYYPGGGALSTGTMTIYDSLPKGKTWNSSFTIKAVGIFAPKGTLTPTGNDYVRSLIEGCNTATTYQCIALPPKGPFLASNESWTTGPDPRNGFNPLEGENLVNNEPPNFYLNGVVIHDTGDGTIHTVTPTPGPLPIFGASAAFAFSRRLRKRTRAARLAV